MNNTDAGKELLENAYELESPEDNVAYYKKLASVYDQDFAAGLGYVLPQQVVKRFIKLATSAHSPILDVGCGTGLVADAFDAATMRKADGDDPEIVIDGVDISDEMLAEARSKNQYRNLYQADLTNPLTSINEKYGAILSSGTFTHGHLGPDALVGLLTVAKAGSLFVITINKVHYSKLKFDEALQNLSDTANVNDLATEEIDLYSAEDHEHANDKGLLVTFQS